MKNDQRLHTHQNLKTEELGSLMESARLQNKFGLTKEQHELYMQNLDKIRVTRVNSQFSRKHANSVNRVLSKISKLKSHYGNSRLMASYLDARSDVLVNSNTESV